MESQPAYMKTVGQSESGIAFRAKAQHGRESICTAENVTDISECYFYHVTDLPGYGQVGEEWDLRGGEESYAAPFRFKESAFLN